MYCQICGKTGVKLYEVIYKGSRGYACEECIKKYGLIRVRKVNEIREIEYKPLEDRMIKARASIQNTLVKARVKTSRVRLDRLFSEDWELVENYGEVIKRARERLGLTQEDLARELKVKVSYIKKVESGRLIPDMDLVRRLERLLNISLTKEKAEEESEEYYYESEGEYEYTLGDLIKYEGGEGE